MEEGAKEVTFLVEKRSFFGKRAGYLQKQSCFSECYISLCLPFVLQLFTAKSRTTYT
jgi:hypothetical protein